MAGNDDHIGLASVPGRKFPQPRDAEHIKVPHLIGELAIVPELVGNVVVGPARVLSRVEVLVSNHNAEIGFGGSVVA
jgi:hypothetical protein